MLEIYGTITHIVADVFVHRIKKSHHQLNQPPTLQTPYRLSFLANTAFGDALVYIVGAEGYFAGGVAHVYGYLAYVVGNGTGLCAEGCYVNPYCYHKAIHGVFLAVGGGVYYFFYMQQQLLQRGNVQLIVRGHGYIVA